MNKSLVVQNEINQSRLQAHLNFIDSFEPWCKVKNWRPVIYGGYGLDGYLHTITRNHGDIDLVIYGRSPRAEALAKIIDYLNNEIKDVSIESHYEDFLIDIKVKSKRLSGNFYYVQTADDPYTNLNRVIKSDGTIVTNKPTDFPPPVKGKLGYLSVEVQDQSAHLKDILRKRAEVEILTKHDQDILNLQSLLTQT